MGFMLTMVEGKEAGREFVFDQPSVTIGRTSDCDIVLFDPGVSRKHARVFAESGAYHVEDLGSSNGTKVNGAVVRRQHLQSADIVAVGPVTFRFSPQDANEVSDDDPTRGAGIEDVSTRIVGRGKSGNLALVPPGADDSELEELGRSLTAIPDGPSPPALTPGGARIAARRRSSGLSDSDTQEASRAMGADASAAPELPEDETRSRRLRSRAGARPERTPQLSAAERARFKREHPGALGEMQLSWREAPLIRRLFVGLVSVLFIGALLGAGAYFGLGLGQDSVSLPPEPRVLGREPLPYAFGLGPDVDYPRPDMKEFDFEFTSPVRAVVLLRFQARDVSTNEVSVTVNGSAVGFVPADTLNSTERSLEIVLPASVLKAGVRNQVVFDNVKNPPGQERWRIWKPWVDVVLLPEGIPPAQLRKEAEQAYARGQLAFERRDVGASNRYEAWREFRSAWLFLEGHPDPKPELHLLARESTVRAQLELDRICAKLVLEVQREFNQKNLDGVRSTLEHMRDYFPSKDQPCYFRPDEIRYQLDL